MDEKQQIHDIINQLHDIINIKYIKKQNTKPSCKEVKLSL